MIRAQPDDVLELDELWSFVLKKSNKRWVSIALCRRTRQIVAFFIENRDEASCRQLWQRIPASYKHWATYSDFWQAYQKVFSPGKHQSVGKESGQTAHSKSDTFHELVLKWFIHYYNLQCTS